MAACSEDDHRRRAQKHGHTRRHPLGHRGGITRFRRIWLLDDQRRGKGTDPRLNLSPRQTVLDGRLCHRCLLPPVWPRGSGMVARRSHTFAPSSDCFVLALNLEFLGEPFRHAAANQGAKQDDHGHLEDRLRPHLDPPCYPRTPAQSRHLRRHFAGEGAASACHNKDAPPEENGATPMPV